MNKSVVSALALIIGSSLTQFCWADDWSRFLGPNGGGIGAGKVVPSEWSISKNLKWRTLLPGFGSSCPIVVGDRVILTCYSGYGLDSNAPGELTKLTRHLVCYDRKTGNQIFDTPIPSTSVEDPYGGFITEHGYASSTPTSDGKRIFAFFGKTGVVAFDMDGKVLWTTGLGTYSDPAKWGDGSSPILYKDLVIVNAGIVGHKIVALKQDSGTEVWKLENEKFTNTWSTPILIEVDGHSELVCSIPQKVFALNPDTGEELWFAASPVQNTVCPSLAHKGDVVFAMGGRGGAGVAIRCGGRGDVTSTHTVWNMPVKAGISTPVVAGDFLVWSSTGLLTCVNCQTGEEVYRERISGAAAAPRRPAGDYSSAVVSGDQIISISRGGLATVVRVGDKFEKIGEGNFADDPGPFNATPAISDGDLFVRSNQSLYCIGNQ